MDVWLEAQKRRGAGVEMCSYVRRRVVKKAEEVPRPKTSNVRQDETKRWLLGATDELPFTIASQRVIAEEKELASPIMKLDEITFFISPDYLGHYYISSAVTTSEEGESSNRSGCVLKSKEEKYDIWLGRGVQETWITAEGRTRHGFTVDDLMHIVLDRYSVGVTLKRFTEPLLDSVQQPNVNRNPQNLHTALDEGYKIWFAKHKWGWVPYVEKAEAF
ncbi:hypothetical protein BT69DRAFT_1284964 [Atractiella rhizophila]|nr:hypothetical protein BT69DRAFT_1284964 [Atractiella rhizophila]